MNRILDVLTWPVRWVMDPLTEPLMRIMEVTGLIRPVEAIVKWIAKRLPPEDPAA